MSVSPSVCTSVFMCVCVCVCVCLFLLCPCLFLHLLFPSGGSKLGEVYEGANAQATVHHQKGFVNMENGEL